MIKSILKGRAKKGRQNGKEKEKEDVKEKEGDK